MQAYIHANHTREDVLVLEKTDALVERVLVLYNDEVNTFDWVIESLIEVCGHSAEQAEQCAMIVHYKGKYAVLHGNFDFLEPRCTALLERGLSAEIH